VTEPATAAAAAPGSADPGFDGRVTVRIDDAEISLRGRLRGQFDPIDGRYHWYGRLAVSPELAAHAARAPIQVQVVTPAGAAGGTLGDPDMWGRLRVSGTGRPPFALPELDDDDGMTGSTPATGGRTRD
jgi:hypothetical protein